jgi:glycosyltransferase involved in cell wall biosynthesis
VAAAGARSSWPRACAAGARASHRAAVVWRADGEEPPEYDGFRPIGFNGWAPPVPFVRNYFKNERFYRRFSAFLTDFIRRHGVGLVHAQHVLTSPPSITAARSVGVPVVCTVRDYWPVCYWSDLIHDPQAQGLCPGCTAARMTQCIRPHGGALWPLGLPAIPYMRANLSLKRASLAAADAVIGVSSAIAADLRRRAPELASTRIEMIHNPVDVAGIRDQAESAARPMPGPYALYVGKLEPNKGVSKLLAAVERARLDWPLVVVGDGSERAELEEAARRSGRCSVRGLASARRSSRVAAARGTARVSFTRPRVPESCAARSQHARGCDCRNGDRRYFGHRRARGDGAAVALGGRAWR